MQNAPRKAGNLRSKPGSIRKSSKSFVETLLKRIMFFEVKPSKKSLIPTRAVDPETNINDSEAEGESTLEPEFVIPEGPPTCDEEKVARMIARGFSDQLIISICGKGVIREKDETVYVAPGLGNACQDSRVFNALKQKICSQR